MTSGTINEAVDQHNVSYVTWQGDDGKYEIEFDGRKSIKWNKYTKLHITYNSSIGKGGNRMTCLGRPGDGSAENRSQLAELQGDLVSKIREHDFNLGITMAEGRETIDMVRNAVFSIAKSIRHLRQGDFKKAAKQLGVSKTNSKLHPNDVAGRWLELQLGWKPLLSDVEEAAKALAFAVSQKRVDMNVVKVRKRLIYPFEGSSSPTNYTCPGSVTIVESLWYQILESDEMKAARSLGLENPASIAWELVPFSFVFDWFLPIGTFLDNAAVIPRLEGKSMYQRVSKSSSTLEKILPLNYSSYEGGTCSASNLSIKRTVSAKGVALAFPNFRSVDQALTSTHIMDIIALGQQMAFKKK